jgi:DNA-binding FadR family transcriptional regulator
MARPVTVDSSYLFRASLLDQLHSGQWQAGERLPTEREFGEQYQISRSTVRKVLADMKAQGLIAQTVGSGTYVTDKVRAWASPVGATSGSEATWQTSPAELMQARMALEPAIIEMVIGNATPADFEQMENCCDRAEAATSVEEFEVWDGMFHEVIARAAHNSFVARLFKLMNQARAQGEWGMLKKRSLTPERRLAYQAEHRALLLAIKARDPVQARALAIEHLVHVRRNLLND